MVHQRDTHYGEWGQPSQLPAMSHQTQHHHPSAQQQYGRMAALSNASATTNPGISGMGGGEHQPSLLAAESQGADENRRTLGYIAQLLNPDTRETALLELSKKREQVPELALVLWHSFGKLGL